MINEPLTFVSGLPPAPWVSRRCVGRPRAPLVETPVPPPLAFVPPLLASVPPPLERTTPPRLSCTSPATRLQTTYSNSSPALLDSGRKLSPIE